MTRGATATWPLVIHGVSPRDCHLKDGAQCENQRSMANVLVAAAVAAIDASHCVNYNDPYDKLRNVNLMTTAKTRRQAVLSLVSALPSSAALNDSQILTNSLPLTSASLLGAPNLIASSSLQSYDRTWSAKKGAPPLMPAVMTPVGPLDLSNLLLRNRIVFLGQTVNSQVAQRVISQLLMLAAIDEDNEIKLYINCPGGSTYSVLAIYDCIAWIKPKVSTICFGMAASQGALLLAGGEKGKRLAMPNARIMIHQPQGGCGGTLEDVRRQANEVVASRDKIDKMYAAFTGQPLEQVQMFTERDRFFSAAEAMEFGLIDGLLETEY